MDHPAAGVACVRHTPSQAHGSTLTQLQHRHRAADRGADAVDHPARALFDNGWLAAKLALLVVYVGLGTFALKRGRTPRVRAICYVAALLVTSP